MFIFRNFLPSNHRVIDVSVLCSSMSMPPLFIVITSSNVHFWIDERYIVLVLFVVKNLRSNKAVLGEIIFKKFYLF